MYINAEWYVNENSTNVKWAEIFYDQPLYINSEDKKIFTPWPVSKIIIEYCIDTI